MGYFLLWAEHLIFALLLAAWALAATRLWKSGGGRWLVRSMTFVGPLLAWIAITAALRAARAPGRDWASAMTISLGAGLLIVAIAYRLKRGSESRRVNYMMGVVLCLVLQLATFWALDVSIRQQLNTLRVESATLALSTSPPRVSDAENAATAYLQAIETGLLEHFPDERNDWLDQLTEGTLKDSPELAAHMRRQGPLLQLIREGSARQGCVFDRDWGRPSLGMVLPELQFLRSAARELALESHYFASNDNLAGAYGNLLAMHRVAEHVAQEPILISLLVSLAIDAMAMDQLEQLMLRHPPDAEALKLLAGWEIQPVRPRIERTLRLEEAFGLAIFSQPADMQMIANLTNDGPQSRMVWPSALSPLYRVFLLPRDLHNYRSTMGRFQNASTSPFELSGKDLSVRQDHFTPLSTMIVPAIEACIKQATRGATRQRLVKLAIAAHRRKLLAGNFPTKLDEFPSETLLPLDPFDGKPFKLVRGEDGLTIYSVGIDGVDDGGKPLDNQKQTGDLRWILQRP